GASCGSLGTFEPHESSCRRTRKEPWVPRDIDRACTSGTGQTDSPHTQSTVAPRGQGVLRDNMCDRARSSTCQLLARHTTSKHGRLTIVPFPQVLPVHKVGQGQRMPGDSDDVLAPGLLVDILAIEDREEVAGECRQGQ